MTITNNVHAYLLTMKRSLQSFEIRQAKLKDLCTPGIYSKGLQVLKTKEFRRANNVVKRFSNLTQSHVTVHLQTIIKKPA